MDGYLGLSMGKVLSPSSLHLSMSDKLGEYGCSVQQLPASWPSSVEGVTACAYSHPALAHLPLYTWSNAPAPASYGRESRELLEREQSVTLPQHVGDG